MKKLIRSKYVIIIIAFCSGCVFTALFLTSKTTVEETKTEKTQYKETIENLKEQIESMESVDKKRDKRVETIIIENVDGSKHTKIVEVEKEFETRVKEIKSKYERDLEEKNKLIAKLQEYSKEEINKKSFRIGAGIGTDMKPYGRMSYDILPFIFVGANAKLGSVMIDAGFSF